MAYIKTTWNPGGAPGISATQLNKIEEGISYAHENALMAETIPTTNLNNLKQTGLYYSSSTTNHPSFASDTFFKILVFFTDENNGYQQLITRDGTQYMRSWRVDEWYPWKKVYTGNSITFGTAAPSGGEHGDIYFQY